MLLKPVAWNTYLTLSASSNGWSKQDLKIQIRSWTWKSSWVPSITGFSIILNLAGFVHLADAFSISTLLQGPWWNTSSPYIELLQPSSHQMWALPQTEWDQVLTSILFIVAAVLLPSPTKMTFWAQLLVCVCWQGNAENSKSAIKTHSTAILLWIALSVTSPLHKKSNHFIRIFLGKIYFSLHRTSVTT